MREYLAGYRDAIEKVFEIQKEKPGFPTLKQALLEDYFEKSASGNALGGIAWQDMAKVTLRNVNPYDGTFTTRSLNGAVTLTGNDDTALLESKEL